MEIIKLIAEIAGCITATFAALAILIKPIRERIFKTKKDNKSEREGLQCLIRSDILRLYREHQKEQAMPEYEFECLNRLYKSYKDLGGNSFIDKLYEDIQEWDVIL